MPGSSCGCACTSRPASSASCASSRGTKPTPRLAAAAAGLGVGLVPLLLAQEALDAGRLVQAHPQELPGTQGYWFVRPQHRPGSEALQAFSAWLATHWQK